MNYNKFPLKTAFMLILGLILPIILYIRSNDPYIFLLFSIFSVIIISVGYDLKKNIFFFLFLISFFSFLMGRPFGEALLNIKNNTMLVLTEELENYICIVLSVALISLWFGYSVLGRVHLKLGGWKIKHRITDQNDFRYVKQVSKYMTYLSYSCVLLQTMENVLFVHRYGYLDSYLQHSSALPGIVSQIGELAPIAIAMYWATMPGKKEIRPSMILFAAANGLNIFSGRRYEIVLAVLVLVLYCVYRTRSDGEPWISKNVILGLCILAPAAMIGLMLIQELRAGASLRNIDLAETLGSFFTSIGGSSALIGYEKLYHTGLAKQDVWFSFGNIWRVLHGNIIAEFLGTGHSLVDQTVEMALHGHSFSAYVSYRFFRTRYLNGGGLGSCYLAELMSDFSYVGIVLGNVFIGKLIRKANALKSNALVPNFLTIFMSLYLFRMPRDSFDFFFARFFGIKNILFLLLMYFLWKLQTRKNRFKVRGINQVS